MTETTQIRAVRRKLLRWYGTNARDLPWRKSSDPYCIWVSEIMLQQTRVATVIPYYAEFIKSFPTVHKLAAASEDVVLRHWAGLGYYRRARLLHRGAQDVVAFHDGRVPQDPAERRTISGIGRYTCGAIGSIAFGREEALVDGNVKRVLSRLFAIKDVVNQRVGEERVWSLAEKLVRGRDPGNLNQAVMELGALICVPRTPACERCPLRRDCRANQEGLVHLLPKKIKKAAAKLEHWHAVAPVRISTRSILLHKGTGARFGGLWSLPMVEERETAKNIGTSGVLAEFGISGRERDERTHIRHQLTHRDMHVTLSLAVGARQSVQAPHGLKWVSLDKPANVGLSTLTQKMLLWTRDVLDLQA